MILGRTLLGLLDVNGEKEDHTHVVASTGEHSVGEAYFGVRAVCCSSRDIVIVLLGKALMHRDLSCP